MSGLSGQIRASTSSEKFDLSGYNEVRVRELVEEAFSTPIPVKEMIRFTFIVGGGKLVRAKYPEELPKWMTTALRDIGYTEDRSAAETIDSQGTYKQQHDTGQNLKYVMVYPRVTIVSEAATESKDNEEKSEVLTPELILSRSSLETFKQIVQSKTHSWRQRKAIVTYLESTWNEIKRIEQKLIEATTQLTPEEQAIYDHQGEQIEEKITWCKELLKKMVDEGKLTASEIIQVVHNIDDNIELCETEMTSAKNKAPLEKKLATLKTRKEHLKTITPLRYRFYNHDEIVRLRVSVLELSKLEDKARSCSLSINDLKKLESKSDIEHMILSAEQSARGWFLSDADYEEMCTIEKEEAQKVFTQKQSKSSSSSSSSTANKSKSIPLASGGGGGRQTSGSSSGAGGGGGMKFAKTVNKPSGSSGNKAKSGFAAAFGNDDDSD